MNKPSFLLLRSLNEGCHKVLKPKIIYTERQVIISAAGVRMHGKKSFAPPA